MSESKHYHGRIRAVFYASSDEDILLLKQIGKEPIRALDNDGSLTILTENSGPIARVLLRRGDVKRGAAWNAEDQERDANALRFTAAWNACANIPTEALEAGVVAEMVVLLGKFAAEADQWADAVPDDYRSPCIEPGAKSAYPGSETVFTVGDTRKARALSALLIVAAEDADRRNAMKAVA